MKENEVSENKNELAIKNDNEIISVSIDDLPQIIGSQIESISDLEKKVNDSDASAKTAMSYINSQMGKYEEKSFLGIKYRSGNTKDLIEDTQQAVEKLADAQQVTVEALKKSFEFQKKLSDVSKYLFGLGCSNIAANRVAVRAIEAKLSGASKEKISTLARQEMMSVVRQLKEQEDILRKLEELKEKVKHNAERLNEKDNLDEKQTQQIDTLNSQMSEKDKIDTQQSQKLEELEAQVKSNAERLNENDNLDEELKKQIEELKAKIVENEKDIEQLKKMDRKQNKSILSFMAIVLSVIAIVIGVANIVFRL